MSSLTEIVARARTIAEGRGVDPHTNPIIDAGLTAEALVPHAIRHVLSTASMEEVMDTTVDHEIEIDPDGIGDLPDGVMRGFLDNSYLPETPKSSWLSFPDYNRDRFDNLLCYYTVKNAEFHSSCVPDYGEVVRVIAAVSKTASSNAITASAGTGGFVSLNDVGRRIVAMNAAGVESVNAIIEEWTSTDVVNVRNYRTGSIATVISAAPVSGATVYETTLELIRTLTTVDKGGASDSVTAEAGEGGGTDADIGRLMTIEVAGAITVRAIITDVPTVDSFTIVGYDATTVVDGIARIYRILDPVITLNTPSVPEIPSDPDDDILLSPKLTEGVIEMLAGALTGELSIAMLLGLGAEE